MGTGTVVYERLFTESINCTNKTSRSPPPAPAPISCCNSAGQVMWGARGGRCRHPGPRTAPAAKSRRETGAARAHPRASHGEVPPTQRPSGLGGHVSDAPVETLQLVLSRSQRRGAAFSPQPQLCPSGAAAAGCQAQLRGTTGVAHRPPPGGCWLPVGPGPILWLRTLVLLPADGWSPPRLPGTTGTAAACCCLGDSCQNRPGAQGSH